MLRLKTWVWTVSLIFIETYVACILWNVLAPNPAHIRLLETVFPGFRWLSLEALLLGGIECTLYAVYLATNIVVIHNFFHRRHEHELTRAERKAA